MSKKGTQCINCGHQLNGDENYCSNCSQKNDVSRLNVKEMLTSFFSMFFAFENRFFKTIIPLIIKPGKVAKDYINGKRQRYMNPFQFLFNTTIVFFLISGFVNYVNDLNHIDEKKDKKQQEEIRLNTNKFEEDTLPVLNNYEKLLDSLNQETSFVNRLKNDSIAVAQKDSVFNRLHEIGVQRYCKNEKEYGDEVSANKMAVYLSHYMEKNGVNYDMKYRDGKIVVERFTPKDSLKIVNKINFFFKIVAKNDSLNAREGVVQSGYTITKTNLFLYEKVKDFYEISKDKTSQKMFFNSFVSKISISLFLLLPLFTIFFWLFFIRTKYNYAEHLVLVFNIQTAFFILLLIALVIDVLIGKSFLKMFLLLLFPLYVYKSLRNFYQQKRWKILVKAFLLSVTYFFLSLFFLVALSILVFIF